MLSYALAGADCIDVAADPAVISSAKAAIATARQLADLARCKGFAYRGDPWLMVSFNDGEDPHFRKAEFQFTNCPADCPRPCEWICPAQAIVFPPSRSETVMASSGVIAERCYGCGRCLPVCPIQHITTRSYVATPDSVASLVMQSGADAIEIHTQVGRLDDFRRLWRAIAPWVGNLKLLAISCPDGEGVLDYLWALHALIAPLPCPLIWQTDGRPMSGDIGVGATRAAVRLGQKVLAAGLPGYVQLAGGTNAYTVPKLRSLGLLNPARSEDLSRVPATASASPYIAGVAYGSYARSLMLPLISELEVEEMDLALAARSTATNLTAQSIEKERSRFAGDGNRFAPLHLENSPHLLWKAVELAESLIAPLKFPTSPESL